MGIVQKTALKVTIISYVGMFLGYLNKAVLFLAFMEWEEVGLINVLVVTGMFFSVISSLGLINGTLKFYPFFKETGKRFSFLRFTLGQVLLGIVLTILLVIVLKVPISNYFSEKSPMFVDYYWWLIPIGVGHVLYLLFDAHLKGLFKIVLPVLAYEIFLRLLVTGLLFLMYFEVINFDSFLILHSFVYFLPAIILLIYLYRIGELKLLKGPAISKRFKRIMKSYSRYNYMNSLAATTVITMDSLMITAFLGLESAGVYTTVIFIISALQVPYRAISRVTLPLVPAYWKEKRMEELQSLYTKMSSVSLAIGLFMFLSVWSIRGELFELFSNSAESGIYVFLFIMIGRLFDMYFSINGTILINSSRYKVDFILTIVLLVFIFAFNYWLIPIYGIIGAAISTMSAFVIFNLARMGYVWYKFGLHPFTISQMAVIGLFAFSLTVIELLSIDYSNLVFSIMGNGAIILVLFLLPIYFFKLEPSLREYLNKILGVLLKTKRA